MASIHYLLILLVAFVSVVNLASAATCSDCFVQSRAAYYPNSDEKGTESGACGFGTFGATINGGDVSAAADLYRDGVGCGACYQVRCTNSNYCSDKGVNVVITDQGSGPNTDFILSRHAFGRMAQTTDATASLLALGVVDIEYKRVSCSYPSKNITVKIDENSNYPNYLAFVLWYQQGTSDITAVQLCETKNFRCKLLDRSYGAVWTTTSPPTGSLSLRMLFSNDVTGDETWVVPVNNIPENWKAGDTYDTGVQVRCTNGFYCSDEGAKIVITDQGSGPGDFILSSKAFSRMGVDKYDGAALLTLGVVDIEYRRTSCSYPNKNIIIEIDEHSTYPYYLAFMFWYQQGTKDITKVQLCETKRFSCKLVGRSYGTLWTTTSPPSGALSVRMLFSDDNGNETWVVAVNNIPRRWKAGDKYDTGVQVDL